MYQGDGRLSEAEYEAAQLRILGQGVRLAAASLPVDSQMVLRLEVLADDIMRAADGGPVGPLRLV